PVVGLVWGQDLLQADRYPMALLGRAIREANRPEEVVLQRARLPMPRVYIIPTETPNAFATGRNPEHAAGAATEAILRILTTDELEGVMAHELAHVRNRDILISTIAATLAGAVMVLARIAQFSAFFGGGRSSEEDEGGGGIVGLIVMAVLAPLAAMLVQMAISRSREYQADAAGAQISRKPRALADALEKLEQAAQAMPMDAHPSTAHLFIVNPLTGGSRLRLFSTHPPVEERVARLRAMRVA
ncbi:MAG: M48 family metalloprotease, partial [candidate division NC10 bacterium]|nr:M48 family metalloprotease [candidate division NC10 bacterium]